MLTRKAVCIRRVIQSVENRVFFMVLAGLVLSTLWTGLMADDYYLAIRVLAPSLLPDIHDASLFGMFSVSDGQADTNRYLVEQGLMPWWTSSQFHFQMWRPLAELSHWLDFSLWPQQPLLMHLHQLIWVLLFFWAAYRFLVSLSGDTRVGMLAFVLFAVSANHGQTIAWLASRNTLMATALGVAALLLHVKSRQPAGFATGYRVGALLAFALALLASEYGLSAGAWLFAWTFTLDRGTLLRRVLRLAPYGLVMMLWASVYVYWNYGVAASEYYSDPVRAPGQYGVALLEAVPTIVFNSILHVPAGLLGSAKLGQPGWWVALACCGGFLYLLWDSLQRPAQRFLLLGSALCMLPIAAGPGGPRTLAFVSLGMTPLVAGLILQWVGTSMGQRGQRPMAGILLWPVLIFTLLSLATLPTVSVLYRQHDRDNVAQPARQLPVTAADTERAVVLINPNSVFYAIFYPLARAYQGLPNPRAFYPLASGDRLMSLQRDGENSFLLSPEGGFLLEPAAYFMRSREEAFTVGQTFEFDGMTVAILSLLEDGRPATARFVFDLPLESGQIRLLHCADHRFLPLQVPPVGVTIQLAPCGE